ncbi:hypothetical protein N6H14_14710 [Paenibacillus sp. CC-CFT747]|nr:hypothetical protein N6H14_14710 [Paenibacillus sp. CC-CFT747]
MYSSGSGLLDITGASATRSVWEGATGANKYFGYEYVSSAPLFDHWGNHMKSFYYSKASGEIDSTAAILSSCHQLRSLTNYTRSLLTSLAYEEGSNSYSRPVSINRIVRQLKPLIGSHYDMLQLHEKENAKGPASVIVKLLGDLSEYIHLGDGYYLPAPPRVVLLPSVKEAILLGHSATAIQASVEQHVGISNLVLSRTTIESLPKLEYQDWLRSPGLTGWLDRLIARAEAKEQFFNEIEIYKPWLKGLKWDMLKDSPAIGQVNLLRERPGNGPFHFFLWKAVRKDKGLYYKLPEGELLRTIHALHYESRQLRVLYTKRASNLYILRPQLKLPPEELKVLRAFAMPRPLGYQAWSKEWVCTDKALPMLSDLFQGLGISMYETKEA